MSINTKKVMTYRIDEEPRSLGPHSRTRIIIEERERALLKDISGDFGESDGVITDDNGDHWVRPVGDKYCYRTCRIGMKEVGLDYLHFGEDGYCSHEILEFRGGLASASWGVKILTKLSRQIAKSRGEYFGSGSKYNYSYALNSPQSVITALDEMGVVNIYDTRRKA